MNDRLYRFFKNPLAVSTVAGVLGLSGGIGIGYVLGKKDTEKVWTEINEQNLDIIRQYEKLTAQMQEDLDTRVVPPKVVIDAEVYKEIVNQSNMSIDEESTEADEIQEPELEGDTDEDDVPEIVNVFANTAGPWNYEAEKNVRSFNVPYVIHVDEFISEEMGCNQYTVTFYAKDGMVANEDESPMYNWSSILGDLKFGHGSNDPNVVYIRNEKLKSEYEVLLTHESYEEEVMGLQAEEELRHSDRRHVVPKFRME